MSIVEINNLSFSYSPESRDNCIRSISFTVEKGEIFSVIGVNGSGKSTIARHLNALLLPQTGNVSVCSLDTSAAENTAEIRKKCGMVFSHSRERFFTSHVRDEVEFALMCTGCDAENTDEKVNECLKLAGLSSCENAPLDTLSEYECLCVQLADVLTAQPEIIVFDNAASLICGEDRRKYLELLPRLRKNGKTIILFSNRFDEAAVSDRTLLLSDGYALACGDTREVLTDRELLKKAGIELPFPLKVFYDLLDSDIKLEKPPLNLGELVDEICL